MHSLTFDQLLRVRTTTSQGRLTHSQPLAQVQLARLERAEGPGSKGAPFLGPAGAVHLGQVPVVPV
eukprot:scaffold23392_cov22-Tisochrysis_lutea.AAC.1